MVVTWTFSFSWSLNLCTAAEEVTGKCEKTLNPVEQSVLCWLWSPQIKSYFRIGQVDGRPVTVATVTNKYVWFPEALPRKRMLAFVMKFINFVYPLFIFKVVNSNKLVITCSPFLLRFGANLGPISLSAVVSFWCVVLVSLIACRGLWEPQRSTQECSNEKTRALLCYFNNSGPQFH